MRQEQCSARIRRVNIPGACSIPATGAWNTATTTLVFTYKSRTNSALTQDPLFVIDSYSILDFRVSLASSADTWKISGWVRNAADEFYSHGTFNTGDTISRYAGMTRTYGGTLSYRF